MRKGIAMIELIFAIVILSFIMLSLPMLVMQTKKTQSLSVKQETISMISSHVNMIMTYQWDDIQTRENNQNFILNTEDGNSNLEFNNITLLRGSRTAFQNTRLFSSIKKIEASDDLKIEYDKNTTNYIDDIDDFNNKENTLVIYDDVNDDSDYIEQEIKIKTKIDYLSINDISSKDVDFQINGTNNKSTNLKRITSILTSDKNKLKLISFSSNIGGYNTEVLGGF